MKTYYIRYFTQDPTGIVQSCVIRDTPHDMDTVSGLGSVIRELREERGQDTMIDSWRELRDE